MKQQLLVIDRSRRRAPNLSALDRFLFGFWSMLLDPRRLQRAAVIIRPSTLLKFHDLLKKRKYRLLYSSSKHGKPGPGGPSPGLIQALVESNQQQALQATTQPVLWLPWNRAADQQSVWNQNRQGCR